MNSAAPQRQFRKVLIRSADSRLRDENQEVRVSSPGQLRCLPKQRLPRGSRKINIWKEFQTNQDQSV